MTDIELKEKIIPQLIKFVNEDNIDGVKQILLDGSAKIEDVDDTGMTALQHACYKGYLEMAKLLLKYGADVNTNHHSHKYSSLHFAAISGNIEIVKAMLSAGARQYHTNSLSRTASQMASFVGNHRLVAVINNFIPDSSILYYTMIQGLETEAKLPSEVANPLHDLIMQANLHPVFVCLYARNIPVFLISDNLHKASCVLSLLCKKEVKRAENVNEILCLKLHFLSYVLTALSNELEKEKSVEEPSKRFDNILRKWLTTRNSDGFQLCLDIFVRDSMKTFPYMEMPLFMQLCQSFSVKEEHVWTIDILNNAINGIREATENYCASCDSQNDGAKKCSKCKSVLYCDAICQRLHWRAHRKVCDGMLKTFVERQKRKVEEEEKLEEEEMRKTLEKLNVQNTSI